MLYGKLGFAALAYLLMFATCAVLDDFKPAFLLTAAVSVLLLLAGAALFPRTQAAFRIGIPNVGEDDSDFHSLHLAGTQIALRPYVQVATCILSLRHVPELVACAVLSIATIVVVSSGMASYESLLLSWGLFVLEGACIAGAIVLLTCLQWADECLVLKRSHATVAPITGMHSTLAYHQQLSYEFVEGSGNRFGGYARVLGGTPENAVVVFYDPNNPDNNRAHLSLIFHRIRIHSVAASRLASASAERELPS